jgi:hypothetical protein
MTLKSRLTHLETQHAARESATAVALYVPPMPPASWWAEFWELIDASPWRSEILAVLEEDLPDAPDYEPDSPTMVVQ